MRFEEKVVLTIDEEPVDVDSRTCSFTVEISGALEGGVSIDFYRSSIKNRLDASLDYDCNFTLSDKVFLSLEKAISIIALAKIKEHLEEENARKPSELENEISSTMQRMAADEKWLSSLQKQKAKLLKERSKK